MSLAPVHDEGLRVASGTRHLDSVHLEEIPGDDFGDFPLLLDRRFVPGPHAPVVEERGEKVLPRQQQVVALPFESVDGLVRPLDERVEPLLVMRIAVLADDAELPVEQADTRFDGDVDSGDRIVARDEVRGLAAGDFHAVAVDVVFP